MNAVGPGPTATEAFDAVSNDDLKNLFVARTPLGRIGAPSDIASVVAFLASPDAEWVTGQVLLANGGFTPYTTGQAARTAPWQPREPPRSRPYPRAGSGTADAQAAHTDLVIQSAIKPSNYLPPTERRFGREDGDSASGPACVVLR